MRRVIVFGLIIVVSLGLAVPRATQAMTATATAITVTPGVALAGVPRDMQPLAQFETSLNRNADIINYFIGFEPNNPLELDRIAAIRADDGWPIPMITLEMWNTTHQEVIAGQHDASFRLWAQQLAQEGGWLYWRIYHEFNGTWFPWSIGRNGQTDQTLIAAWRHIYGIFQTAGAQNVLFVWCPNEVSAGIWDYRTSYPGDAYVHRLGLDGYNWGTDACPTCWRSFGDIYWDDHSRMTQLSSNPIMIVEYASSENGGDKAAWIRDAFATMRQMPAVWAAIWFNLIYQGVDWRVESSPAALTAYREAIAP
jgi:hypothetical protein